MDWKDWRDTSRVLMMIFIVVLASIFIVVSLILADIWRRHPTLSEGLEFEVAKTCMQVLSVVLIGGLATATISHIQHRRDQTLEETRRRGEFLQSMLNQTVSAYNEVKRIRRFFDADTRPANGRKMSLELYDKYVSDINDQQLVFESLKRTAPLADPWVDMNSAAVLNKGEASRFNSLEGLFKKIETSLNAVVKEYQENRYTLPATGAVPLDLEKFQKLESFFKTTDFRRNTSEHIDIIVRSIQTELLNQNKNRRRDAGRRAAQLQTGR